MGLIKLQKKIYFVTILLEESFDFFSSLKSFSVETIIYDVKLKLSVNLLDPVRNPETRNPEIQYPEVKIPKIRIPKNHYPEFTISRKIIFRPNCCNSYINYYYCALLNIFFLFLLYKKNKILIMLNQIHQ